MRQNTLDDVLVATEETRHEVSLVENNPLKAALTYASKDDQKLSTLRQAYIKMTGQPGMNLLSEEVNSKRHLPIEQSVMNKAREIVKPWDWEKENYAKEISLLVDYKEFDPTPLTWRNREGLPRLAVFDVSSTRNDFTILAHPSHPVHTDDMVWIGGPGRSHKLISGYYQDVIQRLWQHAQETKKHQVLQAKFTGLIPDNVRKEILDFLAKAGVYSFAYLVAEVTHWDLQEYDRNALDDFFRKYNRNQDAYDGKHHLPRDPLVIGQVLQMDSENRVVGNKFFLISFFDTTFLEDYLVEKTIQGLV